MCRIPTWEPPGKKSRRSGVRASIVALKPGNSGGAKERRKVDDDKRPTPTNNPDRVSFGLSPWDVVPAHVTGIHLDVGTHRHVDDQ